MFGDIVKLYLTKSANLVCKELWGGSSHLWKGGWCIPEWVGNIFFNTQMQFTASRAD